MPNVDGGHYFLTVLAPVKIDHSKTDVPRSRVDSLMEILETIPTAQQTPASRASGLVSPLARNRRTHFSRFTVIDDVMYNGRDPQDAILASIAGTNPVIPRPVDDLPRPYLLWTVDFDHPSATDDPTEYLKELWGDCEAMLRAIFEHCYGFSKVDDADSFAAYIIRCRLETTMSFNDYWRFPPPLPTMSYATLLPPLVATGVFTVAWLAAQFMDAAFGPWWLMLPITLAALAFSVWYAYRGVMRAGAKPFATAPASDLPSVLKALYLQREFTQFVQDHQDAAPETLHAAFGEFIAAHKPRDLAGPTQSPGIVP